MAYTATNDYAALDATKPLDSEDAGQIGAVCRETRLVAKTVTELCHGSTGTHIFASAYEVQSAAVPAPSGTGTWFRRLMAGVIGNGVSIGSFNNAMLPIAGTWLVTWSVPAFEVGDASTRLAQATSNSASTAINSLEGVAQGGGGSVNAPVTGFGSQIVVADGTKQYSLEMQHTTDNGTNGWGIGPIGSSTSCQGAVCNWLKIG